MKSLNRAVDAIREQDARMERPPLYGARMWRQVGHLMLNLPLGIAGFVLSVTALSVGLGLSVTVIGLPVLAGLTGAARGLGRAERARVRGMLALDVPGPAPVRQVRPGNWGAITARLADGAGWKAALYQLVMFPWAVFSFAMTLTFLVLGWAMALYPLYQWVFPHYTSWPGYQLFDYTDSHHVRHAYYVQGTWQIVATSVVGVLLVFLTARLVHGLTSVNRAAARGLLGR